MILAVIENNNTYLYKDNNDHSIDESNILGFLINDCISFDLIKQLPIISFYVRISPNKYQRISKEDAYVLYEKILYHLGLKR